MTAPISSRGALSACVFTLSAGLLAYEIVLMRLLLVASWHHFAWLVISIALLGFGASGTALTLLRERLLRNSEPALFGFTLACALSMILALQLAPFLPLEARLLPALLSRQILGWCAFWTLTGLPFFFGAAAIGLALMGAQDHLPRTYAANLMGSALGVLLAAGLMEALPPRWLVPPAAVVTFAATLPWLRRRRRVVLSAAGLLAALIWILVNPPRIRVDSFKYRQHVARLEADGQADLLAEAHGTRALLEVFASQTFHEMPFLGGEIPPPPLSAVLMDGHWTGSLLDVSGLEEARSVDQTLMSVPYSLLRRPPAVLLLGETGGANIWLALRRGATSIRAVHPNGDLFALMNGPLRTRGGSIFGHSGVECVAQDPRHFVEHSDARFDLIHLAGLESWAAGSNALAGLSQDHLVTVEGLSACLDRLSPDGILSVCRGIQLPPRDNAKLLASLSEALAISGRDDVASHVAVVRDYLGACILVKASPWSAPDTALLRRLCRARQLTPVFFPGILDDELNRPDRLPGPEGEAGDWLHHAATKIFSNETEEFIRRWPHDIRPARDDRPFFQNFGKLGQLTALKQSYGDLWLTRGETALLFVLCAAGLIAATGLLLSVLPLLLRFAIRRARGKTATSAYFTAIGLAYLTVEIVLLSRLTHLVGDPVLAAASVIAVLLAFSGFGSFAAQRLTNRSRKLIRILFVALLVTALLEAALMPTIIELCAAFPLGGRVLVAGLLVAPLAFLMGLPMPLGLDLLRRGAPSLLPWAWGVNGFASVLAPPLATALGLIWGFHFAGVLALICYFCAGLLFNRLRAATEA